ncbi:unnamed protein product [Lampetra planeri]
MLPDVVVSVPALQPSPLSTPYIHTLAPLMVEKLKAVERSRPGTPAELQAVQEGIRVLENLVGMGEEQNPAFKIVIGAAPELKSRLESAVRANQASSKAKAAARQAQPTVQAAPTIKLKTSFF